MKAVLHLGYQQQSAKNIFKIGFTNSPKDDGITLF